MVQTAYSLGREVVTRLLHDPGDAELIYLRHGKHLHTQKLQDVAGKIKDTRRKLTGKGNSEEKKSGINLL